MQQWQADGKVAIIDKSENVNVSYTWQQKNETFRLHFYSPFSIESVTISGSYQNFHVLANNSEGTKEVKLEKDLPITELRWWIKGLPAPHWHIEASKYDRYNQLQELRQNGWHIQYLSYHIDRAISLPERLTLAKDDIKIKLYIGTWLE